MPCPEYPSSFADSNEGFVSQERARMIALLKGQVEQTDQPTQPFSEDLWRSLSSSKMTPARRSGESAHFEL